MKIKSVNIHEGEGDAVFEKSKLLYFHFFHFVNLFIQSK